MPRYIDGFVIPLHKDKVDAYRQLAERSAEIWKEHGALDYWECLGDDLDLPDITKFTDLASCKPDETVVFAWAVYESREARDAANEKIMADDRLKAMMSDTDAVIDCQRIAFGGFRELVHA